MFDLEYFIIEHVGFGILLLNVWDSEYLVFIVWYSEYLCLEGIGFKISLS
jgi:hypothetical protein